jgi:hypothetical protein
MAIQPVDLGTILAGPFAGTPALDAELTPSDLPLALFPVRLEARFFAGQGRLAELRLRIYPDKVHIDSHDPALGADEATWGRRFWELWWQAGGVEAGERAAWRALASRFGRERAAWIARALAPLNLDDRPLGGPPRFPDLGPPATAARRALLRLLPERWTATAWARGGPPVVVTGNPVPRDLAIGPDLADTAAAISDDEPAIDDGIRWMVDFDRAEAVGMALRLPLSSTLADTAVDLLLVTGVLPGNGAPELAAQLDAHRYADGLGFLLPGTPTNNTAAGRSGFGAADPEENASFAIEWRSPPPGPDTAAGRAAAAFGAASFARLEHGDATDEAAARAMATALWPATWGYYLAQMIGFDGALTPAGRDWAEAHARAYLRPAGPLPTLRCGRQPYGVLPVTSLDGWTAPGGQGVAPFLANLRDRVWRAAAARAPRIGRGDNLGADLADVLQTGPLATAFRIRGLMGQHFLQHLRAFLGEDLDPGGFWPRLVQLGAGQAAAAGLGFTPALAHAAYDEATRSVLAPLVGDPTALALLLAADPDALASALPARRTPLLEVLLRHALLREHADAAARLIGDPSLARDAELVDLVPGGPPAMTWSAVRARDAGGASLRERLAQGADPALARVREAIAALAALDAPTLERHLIAALDATSHRLDAWVTSLATRRLADLRATQPAGITLGGYGWLENLHPAPPGPPAPAVPDEPGPLATAPNDPGFIHSPSLTQASAAALLRNAHLAHGGRSNTPFAIELTSARVRLAKRLFEGIRQGQPLGALLGYGLERSLHEAGLDDLIDELRALAPLPGAPTPTAARRLVVDGLALSERWDADRDGVLAALPLGSDAARRDKAIKALDALRDAVDAAADAVNAEGAFQMVRGNLPRAAASLDAISSGQAPPPELGFVATPRTGIPVTHRAVVLFAAAGPLARPAGWAAASPRAAADPVLNAWAGRLLGPAVGAEATVGDRIVALTELDLAPIDLVWSAEGAEGLPAEITARLRGTGDGAVILNRRFADLVEVATRTQRLLAGTRPLDGADLQPVRADAAHGLDLAEYAARAAVAEAALATVRDRLRATLASDGDLAPPLRDAAGFGLPNAFPAGTALVPQARAVLAEIDRRLAPVAGPEPGEQVRRDHILARFRAVFGPGFLALPRFSAANAGELAASRADAASLHPGDPLAPWTWLQRMERVRPALARLARPLRQAELLGQEGLALAVAQVPHVAGQVWTALEASLGSDRAISLLLQGAPADLAAPLAGLLVDEWTEVVPSRSETTGIAFQRDPPDSAAPQAILLAVPPVVGRPWTQGLLNRVLAETLDLARQRLAQPNELGAVAHYLPAACLAFNLSGDAVSTDLMALA